MTVKKRDDEIARALIADAADPDAWERVAVVPPSTSPRPAWYGKSRGLAPRQPIGNSEVERFDEARAKRQAAIQPAVDHTSREAEALRRKQLHDAIAALPEGQRHAIQLWLDGFDYPDIAGALRVSLYTVKSRLRNAKRDLRADLEAGRSRHYPHTRRAKSR